VNRVRRAAINRAMEAVEILATGKRQNDACDALRAAFAAELNRASAQDADEPPAPPPPPSGSDGASGGGGPGKDPQ